MTEKKKTEDGGSMFPTDVEVGASQGLTIRDYFAAAALQGMLASGHQEAIETLTITGKGSAPKGIALAAYGFADAMIKARKS